MVSKESPSDYAVLLDELLESVCGAVAPHGAHERRLVADAAIAAAAFPLGQPTEHSASVQSAAAGREVHGPA